MISFFTLCLFVFQKKNPNMRERERERERDYKTIFCTSLSPPLSLFSLRFLFSITLMHLCNFSSLLLNIAIIKTKYERERERDYKTIFCTSLSPSLSFLSSFSFFHNADAFVYFFLLCF